jgi:hypothetical protein
MIHCHNVDGAWILWRRVDIDSMGVEGSLEIMQRQARSSQGLYTVC